MPPIRPNLSCKGFRMNSIKDSSFQLKATSRIQSQKEEVKELREEVIFIQLLFSLFIMEIKIFEKWRNCSNSKRRLFRAINQRSVLLQLLLRAKQFCRQQSNAA